MSHDQAGAMNQTSASSQNARLFVRALRAKACGGTLNAFSSDAWDIGRVLPSGGRSAGGALSPCDQIVHSAGGRSWIVDT